MDLKQFSKFTNDYNIIPTLCSTNQIIKVYYIKNEIFLLYD